MPALRCLRRSRRLSHRPPLDPDFEEFDEHDLQDLQLAYPESGSSRSPLSDPPSLHPTPDDSPILDLCLFPDSLSDNELPIFVPRSSHSRKKKPGHIPRPPNAFMLYRSHLCAKEKIKGTVVNNYCHISRIAATIWRDLPETERAPYRRWAEVVKRRHAEQHPDYKYSPASKKKPVQRRGKKVKSSDEATSVRCDVVASLLKQGIEGNELERRIKKFDEDQEGTSSSFLPFTTMKSKHTRVSSSVRSRKSKKARRCTTGCAEQEYVDVPRPVPDSLPVKAEPSSPCLPSTSSPRPMDILASMEAFVKGEPVERPCPSTEVDVFALRLSPFATHHDLPLFLTAGASSHLAPSSTSFAPFGAEHTCEIKAAEQGVCIDPVLPPENANEDFGGLEIGPYYFGSTSDSTLMDMESLLFAEKEMDFSQWFGYEAAA